MASERNRVHGSDAPETARTGIAPIFPVTAQRAHDRKR